MARIEDGGPAFPRPASEFTKNGTLAGGNDAIDANECMTLRDWFAGMAMQGYCAADDDQELAASLIAKDAYRTADAMLEARKGGA